MALSFRSPIPSPVPTPPTTPTFSQTEELTRIPVYAPHIIQPVVALRRSDVKQKVKSLRGNQYVTLHQALPIQTGTLSPAPRDHGQVPVGQWPQWAYGHDLEPGDPTYHTSTSSPLYHLLTEVKKQWQIPIDKGVAGKIGGYFYMFHPCPETIIDVIPLHKLKPEITNRYLGDIQKLLLFRYLFGLSLSATNIYARPAVKDGAPMMENGFPVFENFYSGNESQPFGLRRGGRSCVPVYVERKSWRFTGTMIKRYFPNALPSKVLRHWWRMENGMEDEKLARLFNWIQRLVEGMEGYSVLPSFVHERAARLLMEY